MDHVVSAFVFYFSNDEMTVQLFYTFNTQILRNGLPQCLLITFHSRSLGIKWFKKSKYVYLFNEFYTKPVNIIQT